MRFLLILSLVGASLPHVHAQLVTGTVYEQGSSGKGSPLPGASVYWPGTSIGTLADQEGKFSLPYDGSHKRLVISHVGFKPDTIIVNGPGEFRVFLRSSFELGEVQVEHRSKSTSISRLNTMKVEQISQKELFKAACCNLSESFETNPSVDVAFTDAITGTKQIQLLGLAGSYTQINQENVPAVRGLFTTSGLEFVPGTWIESIQLSKGTGSVINGYESIAGQLNVELHKPIGKYKLLLNGYGGQGGRYEGNLVFNQQVAPGISTGLLMHASTRNSDTDHNRDGFMDNPTGRQVSLMNRWDFRSDAGFESQLYWRITDLLKEGGSSGMAPAERPVLPYTFSIENRFREIGAKAGFVFPDAGYRSMGLQVSYKNYDNRSRFGETRQYSGQENILYANFIYQGIIGNTNHQFRTGASLLDDHITERFEGDLERREIVPGIFAEYTYTGGEKFSLIAGLRTDNHNLFGTFLTPRLHLRYAPQASSVFRFSVGRGQKTANVLAENTGLMVSSRRFVLPVGFYSRNYIFRPEIAWNSGLNFTRNFTIDYREGYFSADAYYTFFENQVVADLDQSAREVVFSNLSGRSTALSLQAEVSYEVLKHLDIRLAYRFYEVKTQYHLAYLDKPLLARHRAFINLAYETGSGWLFDFTANRVGSKRLPYTGDNDPQYRLAEYSPSYTLLNAQVTKKIGETFDLYAGVENIMDFRQENAVLGSDDLSGHHFDSSLVWGPVFGRMIYAGFRYSLPNAFLEK